MATNADWEFVGGNTSRLYSSISLIDTSTNGSIFFGDSDNPSFGIASGNLTAGHQYRFTVLTTARYESEDVTVGGFAEGILRVNEVAAVPEPETYAMMLAGLGLIGLVARRRKWDPAA